LNPRQLEPQSPEALESADIHGVSEGSPSAEVRQDAPETALAGEVPPADTSIAHGPDAALKEAIKAAVDAGLYGRARALLDVLEKTSAPAEVVDLRDHRRKL
jgi:hypothetical protein